MRVASNTLLMSMNVISEKVEGYENISLAISGNECNLDNIFASELISGGHSKDETQ